MKNKFEVDHIWDYSDEDIYLCKCGEEFITHTMLMEHTAELNPPMESHELGTAGVFIERAAHEKTLKDFNRAIILLQFVIKNERLKYETVKEIQEFLRRVGFYD